MLVKLKQFSMVEVEAEAFGDLDKPDLYHEFYSATSGEPASQSSGLATNAILFLLILTKLIIDISLESYKKGTPLKWGIFT